MEKIIFNLFSPQYEIYLVGGAVRDKFLGRPNKDLDFATSATPEQIKKILQSAGYYTHDVGWAYGTVGTSINDYVVQITTFRKNETYQRHSRQPMVEWGKTIEEDLARRDFTINAMALSPANKLIDIYSGQEHIKQRLLQTPIEARNAFRDDPLRMLRAVRFRSQLNFQYSKEMITALKGQSYRLLILPRERIFEEFKKILCGAYIAAALDDLLFYTLFAYFIPELTVLETINQESTFHHKNVWGHTVDVVQNSPDTIIPRTAALFHDIGKPYVKTLEKGFIHFYRHEEVGALMTKSILQRLGYPKKWINDIVFLVRNHMRPNLYDGSWSDSAIRRFIKDTSPLTDQLLALSRADITSHKAETVIAKLKITEEFEARIAKLAFFREVKSPVSGIDLMEEFNLTPGPKVGELKQRLIDALLEGQLTPEATKIECFEYLKRIGG